MLAKTIAGLGLIIKEMLVDYILYLRDEKPGKKLARSSIKVHLRAVLHFFQINNDDADEFDYRNDDRAYSHKEISQILKACDARVRMMILLLCSLGMRIGALHSLQIGDLIQTETAFNGLNLKSTRSRSMPELVISISPSAHLNVILLSKNIWNIEENQERH